MQRNSGDYPSKDASRSGDWTSCCHWNHRRSSSKWFWLCCCCLQEYDVDKEFQTWKRPSKKLPKSVDSIELATGFYSVFHEAIVTVLKMKANRIKNATYDLLETEDFIMRVMIAVGLGSDTLPKGVKGLSVTKISREFKEQAILSADKLAAF